MRERVFDQTLTPGADPATTLHAGDVQSSSPLRSVLACPACGSRMFQEGRREEHRIIYRCLHCWRLFDGDGPS
jgi:DNA-directed RNA polymerase subunit RPC12/RpoP